jgi:diacylglycerol kinase (ATP)
MNHALVIVSGRSRGPTRPEQRQELVRSVVEAVRSRGHDRVVVVPAAGGAQVAEAARSAVADGARLVVVIGGDGLVREAAGPLTGTEASLAIVPGGTGNVLASALRIPRDPMAAVRLIAQGVPRRIDGGVASWTAAGGDAAQEAFFVACGAGLDARLVAGASLAAKRRFGIAAYMGAALASVGDLRPRETRLVVDGAVHETRSIVVLIANAGELIPGLLRPRRAIRPDDGLLDVFVVHGGMVGSLHGTLELLASTGPRRGRAGLRLEAHEVMVEIEPAEPVQLDGDVLGTSPLEARVVPGALSVLAPGHRPARGRG